MQDIYELIDKLESLTGCEFQINGNGVVCDTWDRGLNPEPDRIVALRIYDLLVDQHGKIGTFDIVPIYEELCGVSMVHINVMSCPMGAQ